MSRAIAPENEIFGIDSQRWGLLTCQLSNWLVGQYASQQLLHVCGDSAREQSDGRENELGSFPFVPEPLPEDIVTLILQIEKDLEATNAEVDAQARVLQFFFCRSIYLALVHSSILSESGASIFRNNNQQDELEI